MTARRRAWGCDTVDLSADIQVGRVFVEWCLPAHSSRISCQVSRINRNRRSTVGTDRSMRLAISTFVNPSNLSSAISRSSSSKEPSKRSIDSWTIANVSADSSRLAALPYGIPTVVRCLSLYDLEQQLPQVVPVLHGRKLSLLRPAKERVECVGNHILFVSRNARRPIQPDSRVRHQLRVKAIPNLLRSLWITFVKQFNPSAD